MGLVAIPKKPGIQFNENGKDILIQILNDTSLYIEVYDEGTENLVYSTSETTDLLGFSAKLSEVLSEVY